MANGSLSRVAENWRRGFPAFFILAICGPTIFAFSYVILGEVAGLVGMNKGVGGALAIFAVALWGPVLLGIFFDADYARRFSTRNLPADDA